MNRSTFRVMAVYIRKIEIFFWPYISAGVIGIGIDMHGVVVDKTCVTARDEKSPCSGRLEVTEANSVTQLLRLG